MTEKQLREKLMELEKHVKSDITEIVKKLPVLEMSDTKLLILSYYLGQTLQIEEIVRYTGLNERTVQKSMRRPQVRELIKQMESKQEMSTDFLKLRLKLEGGNF